MRANRRKEMGMEWDGGGCEQKGGERVSKLPSERRNEQSEEATNKTPNNNSMTPPLNE